jgi:hypothetical protein
VGFGVGLPGFMPLRLFGGTGFFFFPFFEGLAFGHGFFVGLSCGFMAETLATCCTDFVDLAVDLVAVGAFEAVEAMAVPVKRKAAAVMDASSCFKMCSSFP